MIAPDNRSAAARMFAASAFVLALAAGSAQARPSQAELSAIRSNCRSDYMAHCMSVPPGGKEALQCLQSHLDSLSGACKGAVAATMPQPAPPPAAAAPPPPPHKAAKAPPPAPPPPKAAAAPPPAAPGPMMATKEAMKEHCRSDYMAHCMGVPPGGKEALQCIQHHFAELSPACKSAVAATMPHMQPPKAAARHSRERMKAAMPPPPAAMAPAPPPQPDPAMLMERAAELPLRERVRVFRACNQDQAAVCPGMPPGGGRIIACLAMHTDALSPFCRRAVARAMQ
jgi:hypothetical protein